MIIAMWVINGLLAVVFVAAGAVKIVTPAEALRARGMTWVEEYKPATVRVAGWRPGEGRKGRLLSADY